MEEEVHGEKVESDEMEETELGSLECEECEESENHKAIISIQLYATGVHVVPGRVTVIVISKNVNNDTGGVCV